ncbi:hypothetical protein [Reinekea marinisedimentorum]|nr:hypothetical protein [Reinekea marinisedimentorum]
MHSSQDPNSPTSDWLKRVYAELFRRIGVPLEVVYFPGQRANVAAQAGDIDGQFTRIYDYQKLFKDQLRINVPVIKLNTVAYARVEDNLFLPNGWSSFESLNLRIDYVRGIVISDLNLKQWVAPENLTNSTDLREGLLKLKYNRTDVFVHGNIAVEPALDGEEYKDVLTAAGLMDVTLLYPYIHTRHFEYAPKMESALNQMKQEGLLLQYCIDAYGEDYRLFCRSIQPLE